MAHTRFISGFPPAFAETFAEVPARPAWVLAVGAIGAVAVMGIALALTSMQGNWVTADYLACLLAGCGAGLGLTACGMAWSHRTVGQQYEAELAAARLIPSWGQAVRQLVRGQVRQDDDADLVVLMYTRPYEDVLRTWREATANRRWMLCVLAMAGAVLPAIGGVVRLTHDRVVNASSGVLLGPAAFGILIAVVAALAVCWMDQVWDRVFAKWLATCKQLDAEEMNPQPELTGSDNSSNSEMAVSYGSDLDHRQITPPLPTPPKVITEVPAIPTDTVTGELPPVGEQVPSWSYIPLTDPDDNRLTADDDR